MGAFDLARLGGEPERLWGNADEAGGLAQIEPWFFPVRCRAKDRDLVVRSERGDPLARSAITMARHQSVPIKDAGNQIIIGDENQLPDSSDDVGRSAVALPAATLRQAQFGVQAANPMDQENDLGRFVINICDRLMNNGAHDALL